MSTTRARGKEILLRLGAALGAGWLFVFGQTALGVATATRTGMSFDDADSLFVLLAFPVFVAVFCWAFLARSIALVWGVLAGGGALMTLAGWLLGRAGG